MADGASASFTYLETVAWSSALPAHQLTCESSGSSGFGHSPRRGSEVTSNSPERTAYLQTCRPTKPLPPMTSSFFLPPVERPGKLGSCMRGEGTRSAVAALKSQAKERRSRMGVSPTQVEVKVPFDFRARKSDSKTLCAGSAAKKMVTLLCAQVVSRGLWTCSFCGRL